MARRYGCTNGNEAPLRAKEWDTDFGSPAPSPHRVPRVAPSPHRVPRVTPSLHRVPRLPEVYHYSAPVHNSELAPCMCRRARQRHGMHRDWRWHGRVRTSMDERRYSAMGLQGCRGNHHILNCPFIMNPRCMDLKWSTSFRWIYTRESCPLKRQS